MQPRACLTSRIASGIVLGAALLAGAPAPARDFFAAPSGSPRGDGSAVRPWDLATALRGGGGVSPGDTIWLRRGTYRGDFTASLEGTRIAPIVVRGYPGERATIDGSLHLSGAHAWYRDFEITSSATTRVSRETGPYPKDVPRGYLSTAEVPGTGAGLKLIDVVAHDLSSVGLWKEAVDMEVEGCIVYYNGWTAPDRGHGHGIYVQNVSGSKRIAGNVVFRNFDNGIQAYGSAEAGLDDLDIEGNTIFGNGEVIGDPAHNILIGGGRVAERSRVVDNLLYFSAFAHGVQINLGYDPYGAGAAHAVVEGNYLGNGEIRMSDRNRAVTFERNTVYAAPAHFDARRYPRNVYVAARPTASRVFVRRDEYAKGRAIVTVFNWARRPWVEADLSGVLARGARYEVRDAQDYFGAAISSATFDGAPVRLPMKAFAPAEPVGWKRPEPTGPEFNVFVIVPDETSARPAQRRSDSSGTPARRGGTPANGRAAGRAATNR